MATALQPRQRRLFPIRPWRTLREEMDDLLTQFWGEDGGELISPNLDLSETDKMFEVRMDVPGVNPEEIDIQVSGNLLTINGRREEEAEEKGRTFHRFERRYGSFSRSVMLPREIKQDEIEAHYKDGVLRIELPKSEPATTRRITVEP